MGNMLRMREGKEVIGKSDVWQGFSPLHISQVFDLLEERFGFPMRSTPHCPRNWKQEFKEYFDKQPHSIPETTAFMHFGNKHINPILNAILFRSEHHGTFTKLVEYVISGSSQYKRKMTDKDYERRKY